MEIVNSKKRYFYTQTEAAEFLGITVGSVINAISRGDLVGVRPVLFLKVEGKEVLVKGKDVQLSKDLVTTESLKKFKEIREKRATEGKFGKARRGTAIQATVQKGGTGTLPNGKKEQTFVNEVQAAEKLKIGRTKLRSRLKDGKPLEGGIVVVKM